MIWTILIIGAGILLIRFFLSLNKDNDDLQNQTLHEKFQFIVDMVNDHAFKGLGTVTILDKRSFNIYQTGQNQIINFQYGTGHLTITWKYKYFQKELVHERQFNNVRNLSIFEQQKIGEIIIREMDQKIQGHQGSVLQDAPIPSGTMKAFYTNALQEKMELELRDLLMNTLKESQSLPDIMHGVAVMQSAGNFSQNMKDSFKGMKQEFKKLNQDFIDEDEYNEMVDEVTSKVLGEFIELPPNK